MLPRFSHCEKNAIIRAVPLRLEHPIERGEEGGVGGGGTVGFSAGGDVGVAQDVCEGDVVLAEDWEEIFDSGEEGVLAQGCLVGIAFPGEADAE